LTARVAIDPNVRVRGNQTYAGLEDVEGTVAVGSHVEVYEPESGLTGPAEVTEVDHERRLIYLAVDWGKLREGAPAAPPWLVFLRDRVVPRLREFLAKRGGNSPRPPRLGGHMRHLEH
jgi:hypothetical protein